jgi:hypothetical protein
MPDSPVDAAPLGSDFSGVFDLDRSLSVVTGRRCHLEAIARSFLQSPGSEPDAPEVGLGLSTLVGEDLDTRTLAAQAEQQALLDERTSDASASASDDGNGNVLLSVVIEGDDGPFSFVLSPTQLTSGTLELKGK